MLRNRILHFRVGSSDKIYIIGIAQTTSTQFDVVTKWGRRGGNIQAQVKGVFNSETSARRKMNDLASEKMAKGYEDIEEGSYLGVVTIASVQKHLQPDVTNNDAKNRLAEEQKKAEQEALDAAAANSSFPEHNNIDPIQVNDKKFKVKCVNNIGIEERFDLEAEYMAQKHSDKEMMFVIDQVGNRDEFFAERFIKV